MNVFSVSSDGKLAVRASERSSQSDFDYLIGNWNIRNRTLKHPLAGSNEWEEFDATQEFRLILLGLGNVDIFHTELDGKPFEGLTVRLFDPQTPSNVGMELVLDLFTALNDSRPHTMRTTC